MTQAERAANGENMTEYQTQQVVLGGGSVHADYWEAHYKSLSDYNSHCHSIMMEYDDHYRGEIDEEILAGRYLAELV